MKSISPERLKFERTHETTRRAEGSKIEENPRDDFAGRLEAARDASHRSDHGADRTERGELRRDGSSRTEAAQDNSDAPSERVEAHEMLVHLYSDLREIVIPDVFGVEGTPSGLEDGEAPTLTSQVPSTGNALNVLSTGSLGHEEAATVQPTSTSRELHAPVSSSPDTSASSNMPKGEGAAETDRDASSTPRVEVKPSEEPPQTDRVDVASEDPPMPLKPPEVMRLKLVGTEVVHHAQVMASAMLESSTGDESFEPELESFDFQDIRTELPQVRHLDRGAPVEASRPIGEQVTDAVQKLLAEQQADSLTDLVRFRTEEGQQFTALIRHDVRGLELRLMAEDGATRSLLGDRLPEVRQALERAGLSAQVSVDRDPSRGSARRPFEPDEELPPAVAPAFRRQDPSSETAGLHLIL
jgi:hypothetical protein